MSCAETTEFWKGHFGNEYIDRNDDHVHKVIPFFSRIILRCSTQINSVLEFGSNIGQNIQALQTLLPGGSFSAVEVNRQAADVFRQRLPGAEMYCMPVQDFKADKSWDFVFTKGVLIHIHPDDLPAVYDRMYSCSSKYVLVAEYYNPTPVDINYRGHTAKLFKRDFAGEMMDRFQDLRLVDYGFAYHRDFHFEGDDITWFLLEKSA